MEKKMLKGNLYELRDAIENVKLIGDNHLNYLLSLNQIELDNHIKILDGQNKPSDRFLEYEQKRRGLISAQSHCSPDGSPILYANPDGTGDIVTDQRKKGYPKIIGDVGELTKQIIALQEEYKEDIEIETKRYETWLKSLEEETAITIKPIPLSLFPKIEYEQMLVFTKLGVIKPLEDETN